MRKRNVKKIIKRVCVYFVIIVLFILLSACEKKLPKDSGNSGDTEEQTTQENATDKEQKVKDVELADMKKYDSISNQKYAWWFKRNDNHMPSDCDQSIDLSKYNAYYIANCNDGVSSDEKRIYLTFDCGYDNGYTEKMLDVLKKYDIKACFFVTGTYIRDNADLVKRMKSEGHLVGNHTVYHPNLIEMSNEEIVEEIKGCSDYMKEVTGYEMDAFFRPPCGEYSERVLAIAKDMGYKTIFWSMAYLDYEVDNQPGREYVISHFERFAHPDAIVLLHNVSSSNAEALESVICNLKSAGYSFGTLLEIE